MISPNDRQFIDYLRGALILRVVLAHLGLSWVFLPYTSYIEMFFPALFLVSGIVTYNSFINRKAGTGKFFARRNVNLLTTYYLISGLALAISFIIGYSHAPSLGQLLDWLLINQRPEDQPYHMTQIWFLRSLAIITVLSIPFFIVSERCKKILLLPVFLSLILGAVQLITPIGSNFSLKLGEINRINMYHPLANFGYFCFGAWCIQNNFLSKKIIMLALSLLCIAVSISIFLALSLEPKLSYHSYYQNAYYMLLGYAAIFIIFSAREYLKLFIEKFFPVRAMFLFFSYHAFSIFLVHSFFIVFSESVFGWKNSASPEVIIPKILFVLALSCLSAIPLTYISKKISEFIIEKFHLK